MTATFEEDPLALYCSFCKKPLRGHWRGRPCLNGKAVMFFELELAQELKERRIEWGE